MPKEKSPSDARALDGKIQLMRGELARRVGIGIESLRFYERKKILSKPARTQSGYRLYEESQVQRLRFVKKAQVLGFTLEEIRELLDLVENSRLKCGTVKTLAEEKIREVELKITDLKNLKDALVNLTSQCDSEKSIRQCPIIESLS